MTFQTSNQSYSIASGAYSTAPFITIIKDRAPNGNDIGDFKVGQRWLDSSDSYEEYFLVGFTTTGGVYQANWVVISPSAETIQTLTGNSGGSVSPDTAGNVSFLGDTVGINIVGSPSTNTLTASITAAVPVKFNGDSGSATPVSNTLVIAGSSTAGTSTSAASDTVTVSTTFASFSAGVLSFATPGGGTTGLSMASTGSVTLPVSTKCGSGFLPIFGPSGGIAPLIVTQSNSGKAVILEVYNSSNTANSQTIMGVICEASATNAYTSWGISNTSSIWNMGIFVSDGSLRITQNGAGPGTGDNFTLSTSGNATFSGLVAASGLQVGGTGPKIESGAGAPSFNAPKGSLYLNTSGSGVNDRAYIATDAVGTWTAIVTVA